MVDFQYYTGLAQLLEMVLKIFYRIMKHILRAIWKFLAREWFLFLALTVIGLIVLLFELV